MLALCASIGWLMYSATPRKFVFRVSSSPENFEKADYAWRQAMQTIRTIDGRLPSGESPDRKLTRTDVTPGIIKKTIWTAPVPPPIPVQKGSVITEVTAGGKKLQLHTPSGWKVLKNADGTFSLASTELHGAVKLSVASDLDSDPPGKALVRSSSATLGTFTKVSARIEKGPFTSRSQTSVIEIYRIGVATAKPIYSFDAAGAIGDYYCVITWTSNDAAGAVRDHRALESLVEIMSVELAP